jgi:cellulose synthase/poly-beta-1,6-N-acetylglucosamine synthase-like glycosyltransferase
MAGDSTTQMFSLSLILQSALCCVLVLLAFLSSQLIGLTLVRILAPRRQLRTVALPEAALPRVLVQLPVCDEGPLALRVAQAAARLDWPSDKLEIQLLDDGRSMGHAALRQAISRTIPRHLDVKVLRRGNRMGFKAGNLAFGLSQSDAPYVAIFDADFVPPADFLRRTVPALLADERLAFVQARWGHANRGCNWLTRAQGFLLDGHFAVEQEARYRAGLPISFNGTGGVWSRAAIESAGGWTGDTLTEDLDLSMRCTLKGWRGAMVSDLEVPGELPETAAGWRAQQARWTRGHAQVAKKLLPEIWASELSIWLKAVLTLQICQFAFYTLAAASVLVSLSLTALAAVYLKPVAELGLSVSVLGLLASVAYLYIGQTMLARSEERDLPVSLMMAIIFPSGLILANARATFEAFFAAPMDFTPTPKAGGVCLTAWRGHQELFAGLFLPLFALAEHAWSAPFFVFAAAGLLSIGLMGRSSAAQSPAAEAVAANRQN